MNSAYKKLPQEIQDWLNSESVDSIFHELQTKYRLSGYEKAAPTFTVTWLAIKTITAKEFTPTLIFEFSLEPARALALAQDLKRRVLLPIKYGLKRMGILIEEIVVTDEALAPLLAPAAPAPTAKERTVRLTPEPQKEPKLRSRAPAPEAPKVSATQKKITGLEPGAKTVDLSKKPYNEHLRSRATQKKAPSVTARTTSFSAPTPVTPPETISAPRQEATPVAPKGPSATISSSDEQFFIEEQDPLAGEETHLEKRQDPHPVPQKEGDQKMVQ